jgi:hypothetical protein
MKSIIVLLSGILLSVSGFAQAEQKKQDKGSRTIDWPVHRGPETRPWTWWWWHGSAADTLNISRSLNSFSKTGLGGVNLVFILDVEDSLAPEVEFLSKHWSDLVTFTVNKARTLGMDADIAPVSGWAFGGSSVTRSNACAEIIMRKFDADHIRRGESIFDRTYGGVFKYDDLEAILAVSDTGDRVLVTHLVGRDGRIDWEIPEGNWTFYATINHPGSSRVRFPTPDQRGFVTDHLKDKAVKEYFNQFTTAFSGYDPESLPRAYNVDSWEINLNWTKGFYEEFQKRRKYDLRLYIPELFRFAPDDQSSGVICDYRETLSDLMLENFNSNFDVWTHEMGGLSIGEILSQPSNILDANALLDIPQMDVGGRLESYVENGRYLTDYYNEKCASSAAHILGKPLIASETLTCMGPVFNTPFDLCKQKLDWDFVSGINHTCFHGITYSPISARWPGWLFYAGTHLGDFNPLWQLSGTQLCAYITRAQSFLQQGRSDKDILFYLPYYDKFSRLDSDPGNAPEWWTTIAANDYPVAQKLLESGCDFDFVSDKMLLNNITSSQGFTVSEANKYRALVVADCQRIPVATLRRIYDLAIQGATVLMIGDLPRDVPGMNDRSERQKQLEELLTVIQSGSKMVEDGISVTPKGSGRIIFSKSIVNSLQHAGIQRESLVNYALQYTRRRDVDGWIYFIANTAEGKNIDKWIPLASKGSCAALFDPMTGEKGLAAYRAETNGGKVFLQLEPNQSVIVKVYDRMMSGEKWKYLAKSGNPVELAEGWTVSFLSGGEDIPHPETIRELSSWTTWESDQKPVLKGFSGVARYRTTFQKPSADADDFILSLGEVSHTARVFLNGMLIGDLISRPMRVKCGNRMKEGLNTLEIQIANAPVNRIADLDIRGVDWYIKTEGMDLSSCDWDNTRKDSTWIPETSGLLGPVELIPVRYK